MAAEDFDGLPLGGSEAIYVDSQGRIIDGETLSLEELLAQLATPPATPGYSRYTLGERELRRDQRRHCGHPPRKPCQLPRYRTDWNRG